MPYTGNVNKILWYFVAPFLVFLYSIFLIFSDHYFLDVNNKGHKAIVEKKMQLFSSNQSLDGVILGGSNALFGLSAGSLSKFTNLRWANMAIPSEGFSSQNYFEFLSKSLSKKTRLEVSYILFSSVKSLRANELTITSTRDIYGKKKLSLVPQKSFAGYVKYFLQPKPEPLPKSDINGDLDFITKNCKLKIVNAVPPYKLVSSSDSILWITHNLIQISKLFPNATIIVEIPNGFTEQSIGDNSLKNFEEQVKKGILEYVKKGSKSIYLTLQHSYPNSNLMCNDSWHANDLGRDWRTKSLYQSVIKEMM
jgi:hypothetical protein